MKIAILGGGLTGLTAAYYLQKKENQVTIFEKEKILGGLASGFIQANWDWHLDRAYHHIFASDSDILNFAREIEFSDFYFRSPETASLYNDVNNYRIIPLDTPQDFLKFPLLSMPEKIRSAFVLAFLKLSPYLTLYERQTADEFLRKTMGINAWNVLWQELFRKKFGKYAEKILAAFIWARINKRTKSLGYVKGGFQAFVDYISNKNVTLGVEIQKGESVGLLISENGGFIVNKQTFDVVISTLPTPILHKLTQNIFPKEYLIKLNSTKYLHAINLILETNEPILEKTYWLSICDPKIPFMVTVQHTNFIDKQYYGGNHIAYIAKYVDDNDKLLKMNKEEIYKYYSSYLKILNSKFSVLNSYLFKVPFAQPIFDKIFIKNKPEFITPIKNFFISNLDMTFPYDRGTNYAVKLGKKVVEMIG